MAEPADTKSSLTCEVCGTSKRKVSMWTVALTEHALPPREVFCLTYYLCEPCKKNLAQSITESFVRVKHDQENRLAK